MTDTPNQTAAKMQREVRNLIGLSKEPIEGGRPISIIKPGAEMA